MKDDLKKITTELENFEFPLWDKLPNIDLYMDQVITYLDRELNPLKVNSLDKLLTTSMINNYVKGSLLPPPSHKKYNSEHLSKLFIISSIKQILSISNIEELLNSQTKDKKELYELFTTVHKSLLNKETEKLTNALQNIQEDSDEELINSVKLYIIHLAVHAEIQKIIAEKLINIINEKHTTELNEQEKLSKEEKIKNKESKKKQQKDETN